MSHKLNVLWWHQVVEFFIDELLPPPLATPAFFFLKPKLTRRGWPTQNGDHLEMLLSLVSLSIRGYHAKRQFTGVVASFDSSSHRTYFISTSFCALGRRQISNRYFYRQGKLYSLRHFCPLFAKLAAPHGKIPRMVMLQPHHTPHLFTANPNTRT